jgi:hypothetical protein
MAASLGVVLPAYRPDVDRLRRYVAALDDRLPAATLRVELDDPRPGVVDDLSALPATVNAVRARRGKGAAITDGFEALDAEHLAFADADGSTPADSVAAVIDRLPAADLAVGSRRHPDARVIGHQTVVRRLLGDGFAWIARRLLDAKLYDYQCGAKAITADAWAGVRDHLYEPGFAWDVELVAMAGALGYRVAEVPIEWEDAPGSTVDPLAASVEMARALFVARHRARRLQGARVHDALAAAGEDPVALIDREEGR